MSDSPMVMLTTGTNAVKALPLSDWTASEMAGRSSDAPSVERLFRQVPAVYRCVTLRAEAVSSVPFEIVRAGSATRSLGFDQAALEQKLPDLLYRLEASLCLYGAGYLMPVRNKVKLLDVRFLAAPTMTPKYDKQAGLAGFARAIGEGEPQSLKVEEVVHVFLPDGTVEIGPGTPPIEAARQAAQGMLNGDAYVSGFFEHGGMNITLLITDPSTSEPELKKLETWWRRLTRGVKQMWTTIALRKNVEVKQLGYPLEQLAMDKTEAGWRGKVANAFGVPEYYLSSDVANFATAKSYDLTFMERVITAELEIIGGALNAQLLGPMGYELVFHPERLEVFQESEFKKAQSVSEAVGQPVLTVNEGREALGYEPLNEEGANRITKPTPAPATAPTPAANGAGPAASDAATAPVGEASVGQADVMKALLTELRLAREAVAEATKTVASGEWRVASEEGEGEGEVTTEGTENTEGGAL